MKNSVQIALIGDFDPAKPSHPATENALQHAAAHVGVQVNTIWVATSDLENDVAKKLDAFDAFLCTPGSPYRSLQGALNAIHFARESGKPFLGTCGGCQHAILEYAINHLGMADAVHEEYMEGKNRLVSRLACPLHDTEQNIRLLAPSMVRDIYGQNDIREYYFCSFGINPVYQQQFEDSGFRITGMDAQGEARAMELAGHSFYVATLFQPQLRSTPEHPHALIVDFIRKIAEFYVVAKLGMHASGGRASPDPQGA